MIIAGHTRLLAAKRLGLEQVPVHVASGLTPQQVKAYRIADNRSAQETTWDFDLLPLELTELGDLDYDLGAHRLRPGRARRLPRRADRGAHRPRPRARGARRADQQARRPLPARRAPPALRRRDQRRRRRAPDGGEEGDPHGHRPALPRRLPRRRSTRRARPTAAPTSKDKHWDAYIDHEHSVDFYVDFLRAALDHALDDHAAIYQWFGIMRTEVIWQSWREVGLLPHQVLIWKKTPERAHLLALHVGLRADDVRLARGQHAQGEAAGRRKSGLGDREQDRGRAGLGIHPTMKPVETIRRPIAYHTKPGGLIYEPFCGIGHGADRRRGAGADLLRHRAEPAVRRRRRGPVGGVHGQAGEAGVSRGPRSSRSQIRKRVADIYGLVVDGVPHAQIFRFVAANCSWQASERTIESYIARAREQMHRGRAGRAPRGVRRVAGAQAAPLRTGEHRATS